MMNHSGSRFSGGAVSYVFISFITLFVSILTLGLAAPYLLYWRWRWVAEHTYYDEKPLRFDGEPTEFYGKFYLWALLSVVTLGVYAVLFLPGNVLRWKTLHTHFAETPARVVREQNNSRFEASTSDCFIMSLLYRTISVFTLGFGFYWAYCYYQKWLAEHTVIDGHRLGFDGTALPLFGSWVVWTLLSMLTLGIYFFRMPVELLDWVASHTHRQFQRSGPGYTGTPGEAAPKYDYYSPLGAGRRPPQGMATASLVLGILSLLLLWPLGIGAIILALFAPKTRTNRMQALALAGLICGIAGIVFGIALVWYLYNSLYFLTLFM